MMRRRGVLGLMAAMAAAPVLPACGSLIKPASYRYRMTVTARTPEGERRGSAAHEVMAYRAPALTSEERPVRGELRGEAVPLDLPGSYTVFTLLRQEDGRRDLYETVTRALVGKSDPMSDFDLVDAVRSLGGWLGRAEAELPREHWPLMVRFGDLDDPSTVQLVDPESVPIERIVVATTTDDISTEMVKRLKWLPQQKGSLVKRPPGHFPVTPPLGYQLNELSFSTELNRP